MISSRATRLQLVAGIVLLIVLHFYVRPRLWDTWVSPDFLFIALTFYAMRAGPGAGAVAGLLIGLVNDALTPAHFGAGALAHTTVGYLAAWARALFFADNLLVHAGFVAVGLWLRNLIVLLASGVSQDMLVTELMVRSPMQALLSAGFAALVVVAFHQWFAIRLDT